MYTSTYIYNIKLVSCATFLPKVQTPVYIYIYSFVKYANKKNMCVCDFV